MIKRVLYNGTLWIDLESPTSEEVSAISQEFGLHPVVGSEMLSQSLRPKIDLYTDYLYLILHFANDTEVDFVLGKNFIITTRYEAIDSITQQYRALSMGEQMHTETENISGVLFYYLTKNLYDALEDDLTRLRAHMKKVEEAVYSGHEHEMVMALASSGRQILDLTQSIEPHKEVLDSFDQHAPAFFGQGYTRYASALLGNYYKVHRRITRLAALQGELRATNDSLLATKQNSIMQVFTIVAFLTLIPSLIASVFGMNARNMPFIGHTYDFWILVVIMVVASVSVFSFFRHKRWL